MDAVRFDRLTKSLDAALTRRRALGGLLGLGLTGGSGVERATAKPKPKACKHAPSGHCKTYHICGGNAATCDPGPGIACDCALTVEGCIACINDTVGQECHETDPPCASSAECESRPGFGPGSVCQAPGSGCCGQVCLRPCPS
jgi:hypothetical protein